MLEKNYNIMGTRPKGETWEWFTKKFNLGYIHVHNKNTGNDNLWIFEISISSNTSFKPINGFDTKETAYKNGLKLYQRLLVQELATVQENDKC